MSFKKHLHLTNRNLRRILRQLRDIALFNNDHLLVTTSEQIAHAEYYTISLASRRANQTADHRANGCRAKCDPSGVPAVMVGVVNDMMPRRQ